MNDLKVKQTLGVDSARRVLQILFMFSEDRLELTVEEIARQYAISVPSAYRYVALLREMHLVQAGRNGGIVLAPRVIELANAAERSLEIEKIAEPMLHRLMQHTGETAFMMKRYRNEAIFVMSAQPDRALTLSFRSGRSMPLTHGAVAKVLLAFSPAGFRENYLAEMIKSPRERIALSRELAEIRSNGYDESEAEVDEGIWGCATPVWIGDVVTCAISVAGPATRFDIAKRSEVRNLLVAASTDISKAIERQSDR